MPVFEIQNTMQTLPQQAANNLTRRKFQGKSTRLTNKNRRSHAHAQTNHVAIPNNFAC